MLGEGLGKGRASRRSSSASYVYVLMAFLAGLKAQPVDIYKFFGDAGVDGFNLVASIGGLRARRRASCSSSATPPTADGNGRRARATTRGAAPRSSGSRSRRRRIHNFDAVPDVRSAEPLHDIRRAIRERTRRAGGPPTPARPEATGRSPSPARTEPVGRGTAGTLGRRPGSLTAMHARPRGEAEELSPLPPPPDRDHRRHFRADRDRRRGPRSSDSGLGCGAAGSGTNGWPLCGGRLLPFLQEHQVIEFSHRVVATVVVVLIVALAFRRSGDFATAAGWSGGRWPPASWCSRRRSSAASPSSTASTRPSSPRTSGWRCCCLAC